MARPKFFAIVDDGPILRAVGAQKRVEKAGAHGVARGEVEGHAPLEGFGNVNLSVAQAQTRAQRASCGGASGGEFPDPEPSGRGTDPTIKMEVTVGHRRTPRNVSFHVGCGTGLA